jgi:hypothetical protein
MLGAFLSRSFLPFFALARDLPRRRRMLFPAPRLLARHLEPGRKRSNDSLARFQYE